MSKASRSIEISASPRACYDIITDYESYPEFLKETTSVVVLKKSGHTSEVKFTMELIKSFSYTLKITGTPPKKVKWVLVRGEFMKSNDGEWLIEDLGGGVTRATYTIEVNLGLLVPGIISKMLIGSNLPSMLEAFKKRIEGKKGKK